MDLTQKEMASLGGKAILAKKGKDYFKELAKKSVASRRLKFEQKLQPNIRKDIKVLFDKGMSQSEIAIKLGFSRQRVHQLLTGYKTLSQTKWKNELLSNGCSYCNNYAVAIHHIDGNSHNNDKKNLVPVCHSHHVELHKNL